MYERAEARIDLGNLRHNCRELKSRLTPGVELCPVLKADAYGHGALHCVGAVAEAGADRIAFATASEAVLARSVAPDVPLLVLGALAPGEIEMAISAGADVSAWEPGFLATLADQAAAAGLVVGVHVKYDTGMGRLGTTDPELVLELARTAEAHPNLRLAAIWTHFATADEPDRSFLGQQSVRLAELGERARREFPEVKLHAANSAAMIADPSSHFDMVRPGVAIYGMDPFGNDPADHNLRPVLSLHSWVAAVRDFEPGQSAGYGRTWRAESPTRVATVPVGYGDGVRRGLSNRGEVLIGGDRYPISGTVSMDNITVDLGPDSGAKVGDEVTLIGAQGDEAILAEQIAVPLGTINYEVTCGISPRVPRVGTGSGPN
ncbi:MAG: alanine racemase [Solirubrobacterales bacterium]|nr:alanine racemase [Solirubrobacterales bacterium]MCB8915712.1 alanine racemase [Thermoleophilales bacterium]